MIDLNDTTLPRIPSKCRVTLLALGDVGSTLLTGLRLMGGDVIGSIGICDVRPGVSDRWEFELNQIQSPDGAALPPVDIIAPEQLFDGDVFLFCASRMIPDTSVTAGDVRMAQYGLNRELVSIYARMARDRRYRGLFCVVSDPVDPLCRAVLRESGLSPAQVRASAWALCTPAPCTTPGGTLASRPTSPRAAPSAPTGRIWCWPTPWRITTTPSPVS